ncbi:hypothetical protein DPMN_037482 [Dreissena polymorpha]|uniref:Uncharacterized protein n=1 Tax=Dreissena polymorpha TaxID=45954 RepID=A0A9D4MDM8_DREPO|nr:hypothetical protein DPMN_037482 [Dreissena polymorpha]
MYLQQISNLEETHPDMYRKFGIGFHVVRRSQAGLGRNLVIEQTLMMFFIEHMLSNLRQWNGRGHGNPLDPICNIRAQQCDAGFHKPDKLVY